MGRLVKTLCKRMQYTGCRLRHCRLTECCSCGQGVAPAPCRCLLHNAAIDARGPAGYWLSSQGLLGAMRPAVGWLYPAVCLV